MSGIEVEIERSGSVERALGISQEKGTGANSVCAAVFVLFRFFWPRCAAVYCTWLFILKLRKNLVQIRSGICVFEF